MAAFAIGIALILPPTELKSSWTNVHYATPERVYSPPAPAATEPALFPASASIPPMSDDRLIAVERRQDPRDDDYAAEVRIADDDRAYGDGYTWASDREIDDPRACRRFRGTRAEGCRDYVASIAPDEAEALDEREPATSW